MNETGTALCSGAYNSGEHGAAALQGQLAASVMIEVRVPGHSKGHRAGGGGAWSRQTSLEE